MADHDHRARPRLKQRFETELKPQLQTELGLTNVMQVPQPVKIVVNMGVGRATQQRSLLDGAVTDLTIITGQKPLVTQGEEVDRELQAPRGQRDRRQGDAARRPDVGVLRPAREPRDPAHP